MRPNSHYFEFSGGFLAAVGDHFVFDLRAFIERAQAGLLDRRDVQKHVLAAAVRLDEAITLGRVEPLNSTSSHDILSDTDNDEACCKAHFGPERYPQTPLQRPAPPIT